MSNRLRYILIGILVVFLVIVRFYEEKFFNDRLLNFFTYAYLTDPLPETGFMEIYKIIALRYFVNSLISILILLLLFKQKNLLKFLLLFYFTAFVILSLFLYYEWTHYTPGKYLFLFYVRRLLIHPVFLFILIPALLFHQLEKGK